MRYRVLSPAGDYTFGRGVGEFLVNSPEAVAQAVRTRLALWTGEWFLDNTEGMPYQTQVLGAGTKPLYDAALQKRILGTPGVQGIAAYVSVLDPATRKLYVAATLNTRYGTAAIATQAGA